MYVDIDWGGHTLSPHISGEAVTLAELFFALDRMQRFSKERKTDGGWIKILKVFEYIFDGFIIDVPVISCPNFSPQLTGVFLTLYFMLRNHYRSYLFRSAFKSEHTNKCQINAYK
jgi:hypothetical protein